MLELLFLLLPVAAGYGWIMGRNSIKESQAKASKKFSKQYYKGLNFLLSDQPDKAVDTFIKLLDVDSDTFETHIALGNSFRRKGEIDRAIRIHQNLINREELDTTRRELALLELGKDFLISGLYGRAEKIFLELAHHPIHAKESFTHLLDIYQSTKEWAKAIETADKVTLDKWPELNLMLGHFHCQMAELALEHRDDTGAIGYLRTALELDPKCARACLLMGDILISQNNYKNAQRFLLQILEQDVDLVTESLEQLKQCFTNNGQPQEIIDYLEKCIKQGAGVSVGILLAELTLDTKGKRASQRFVIGQLKQHPTMKGFHRLMGFHLDGVDEEGARDSLRFLQQLVAEQMKIRPEYRCGKCGFSGHTLYWQCPSCKSWGTFKPIRGLDGE